MNPSRDALSQRADYTFTFNRQSGRHGWLRLTPAYSVKIVDELLVSYRARNDRSLRVFDPFCGSATTALSAAYHGHDATTIDINPFLVWFGQAKIAHYDGETLQSARTALDAVDQLLATDPATPVSPPPIHNIERWWAPTVIEFLAHTRLAIKTVAEHDPSVRDLLLIAFCRTLIASSAAAFNHQSMSFKNTTHHEWAKPDLRALFRQEAEFVITSAAANPNGTALVAIGDARNPASSAPGPFDLVITSPPYANRMSYIRELRPYMYWLGYLDHGRDAGELDWSAIGGTWGIATSRLTDWSRSSNHFTNKQLAGIIDRIASSGEKSAQPLAQYVTKYLDDIWTHLNALPTLLAPGAELHYIIGNSTFYGIELPVEQFYVEMLHRLGFTDVLATPIRKRNSNKALFEFDVSALWTQ